MFQLLWSLAWTVLGLGLTSTLILTQKSASLPRFFLFFLERLDLISWSDLHSFGQIRSRPISSLWDQRMQLTKFVCDKNRRRGNSSVRHTPQSTVKSIAPFPNYNSLLSVKRGKCVNISLTTGVKKGLEYKNKVKIHCFLWLWKKTNAILCMQQLTEQTGRKTRVILALFTKTVSMLI